MPKPQTTKSPASIADLLAQATPEAADALRDLAETTPDKETRKEARRALFRLSQSGIAPTKRAAAPTPAAQKPDMLRVFASAIDGAGNRLLLFLLSDPDGGSPTLVQILFNDEQGIQDVGVNRMPRREVDTRVTRFLDQLEQGLALAEIEPEYGRWLLAQARAINQRLSRTTPGGFLDLLPRIGEPHARFDQSPIYAQFPAETVANDLTLARAPEDLFALAWFDAWFLDARDAVPWLEPWEGVDSGTLIVTEDVKQERRERILTDAVGTLLTPELRAHYVSRLEESADVLRRREKTTEAKQALYHAIQLASERPVTEVPFARELIRRTIVAALELVHESQARAAQREKIERP
ncbi:MAG TPA: hypothetical protein VKU00_08995 [Chthonomonadaceae bacterium]|nr:hypothetical protein [Chthonomonadaceae bacterium]